METIEKVFNLLTETPEYVSGQQIANKLNISRTAVWKAVSQFFKATRILNRGQNADGLSRSSVNEIERRWNQTIS